MASTPAPGTPLTVIAVSNMLGDIFDCALALGLPIRRIVLNQPEVLRERTISYRDRLGMLPEPPQVLELDAWRPEPGEAVVLGTTSPKRDALVAELIARHGVAGSDPVGADARTGLSFVTLVHPSATVSPFARLGRGVFVNAGVVLGPNASIGDHAFVNRGVTVGHDTRIGAWTRLQPGCNVGGHVDIGAHVMIGMGANVIEELVVGERSVVAAGAAVISDVPPGVLVAGVPAAVRKTLGA
ncbi:MAG: hypothetical protein RIS35_1575 [Pseudomonadota bacterium]|jgi:UDP-3-O-[3-hydroxymyristoyl] glucosamine N-acyltransferase